MRSYARIRGGEREGAAAVEFALVGPVFFLLVVGMVVYGAWFWMAHSVQSAVSEGARAAIAGLDAAEREQLAREVVETQLKDLGLKAADAVVGVQAEPGRVRVEVAYDAGGHPLMALSPLTVPLPRTIRRAAVIRVEES